MAATALFAGTASADTSVSGTVMSVTSAGGTGSAVITSTTVNWGGATCGTSPFTAVDVQTLANAATLQNPVTVTYVTFNTLVGNGPIKIIVPFNCMTSYQIKAP